MKLALQIIFVFVFSFFTIRAHAQETHVISPRKNVTDPPSIYPQGVYLSDSENDSPYSWPLDAGVVFGFKPAHSIYRHVQFITDAQGNRFQLRTKNSSLDTWGAWRSVVVANEFGNVTIGGTISTNDRLTIMASGAQRSVGLFAASGTGSAGIYFDASDGDFAGNDYASLLQMDDLSIQLKSHGTNPLIFSTNNINRIFIDGQGYIGMGVDVPQQKFHVKGATRIERESGGANYLEFYSDISGNYIRSNDPGTNQKNLYFQVNPTGPDETNRHMHFQAGTIGGVLQTRMFIHANGRIGIGTTSPDATLTVKGDIHAREVKVDLAGAIAPDYVFAPTYDLMPLYKVSQFIRQHSHLPEVSSAKEMESEGINLKDMNLLLLKKVEELTLYVIQLEERDKEYLEMINELKLQMEALKK